VAFSFLLRNANGSTRYADVDDDMMQRCFPLESFRESLRATHARRLGAAL
jgi:hypothetical protein